MKTISVNLYSINELEPKAKENALNKLRDLEAYYINQNVSENFAIELEERKLDLKAFWSLSNCQGDGVAFEGSLSKNDILRLELATIEDIDAIELECIDIKLHGRYTHENSMSLFSHCDNRANNVTIEKVEKSVLEYLQALSKEFKAMGYNDIAHQTSDIVLIDMCEANEYTFEVCGRMRNA
jgi:hypothetical protein